MYKYNIIISITIIVIFIIAIINIIVVVVDNNNNYLLNSPIPPILPYNFIRGAQYIKMTKIPQTCITETYAISYLQSKV